MGKIHYTFDYKIITMEKILTQIIKRNKESEVNKVDPMGIFLNFLDSEKKKREEKQYELHAVAKR